MPSSKLYVVTADNGEFSDRMTLVLATFDTEEGARQYIQSILDHPAVEEDSVVQSGDAWQVRTSGELTIDGQLFTELTFLEIWPVPHNASLSKGPNDDR
jgi:hypothetical protein